MAAIAQKGKGVVAGFPGTFDVMIYVTQQKGDITQHFDESSGKDVLGFTQWLNGRDERAEMEIDIEFIGATNENAQAPMSTSSGVLSTLGQPLLSPFEAVTLSTFTMAALNGVWQTMPGCKFDMENISIGKGRYKLRRWADSTQNTLLNQTPT